MTDSLYQLPLDLDELDMISSLCEMFEIDNDHIKDKDDMPELFALVERIADRVHKLQAGPPKPILPPLDLDVIEIDIQKANQERGRTEWAEAIQPIVQKKLPELIDETRRLRKQNSALRKEVASALPKTQCELGTCHDRWARSRMFRSGDPTDGPST